MRTKERRGGFTLIELLVVVAIISLLAAIAVPNIIGKLRKAKMVKAEGDMESFGTAIEMFYTDTGYLPFKALSTYGYNALVKARGMYTIGMLEAILKVTQYYADYNPSYFRAGVRETVARNYLPDGMPLDPWRQEYVYVERDPRRSVWKYDYQLARARPDLGDVTIPGEDEDSGDSLIYVVLEWRNQRLRVDIDRDYYLWSWGEDNDWGAVGGEWYDDITNWEPNKPYAVFYR